MVLLAGLGAPDCSIAAPVGLPDHFLVAADNHQTTLDRAAGILTSTADLRLHNLGGRTLLGPLHAVIELDSTEVQVPGALGGPTDPVYGAYYYDLSAQLTGGRLEPGSSVQFTLTLVRDRAVDFTYRVIPFTEVETNLPPEVNVDPLVYTVTEGETLSVKVTATDPDGEPVTLGAAPIVDHAFFSPTGGVFAAGDFIFAPERGQRGHCLVTFTARDPGGNTDEETIQITVLPDNAAPTVSAPPEVETDEGRLVTVRVASADPDGDVVTVTASGLPDNAVFIEASRTVSFAPDYGQAGIYTIDFQAFDGALASTVATTRVTVHDITGQPGETNRVSLRVEPVESPTLLAQTLVRGTVNADLALPPAQRITASLIEGLDPVNARQGDTLDVHLMGATSGPFVTHFVDGISEGQFGGGITVNALTVEGPDSATANITVATDASPGAKGVQVKTGSETALSVSAFVVQPGVTTVRGTLVDPDTGLPIAGAIVLIEGTRISGMTGSNGGFVLSGVPTGVSTLVVNAPNHRLLRIDLALQPNQSLDVGEVQSPPTVFDPSAPAGASVLSIIGRGVGDLAGRTTKEDAKAAIRDTLLVVGGTEAGVYDAYGNQLNPEIVGPGLLSLQDNGVNMYADRLVRGESVSLLDVCFDLSQGLAWSSGGAPTWEEWRDALQQIVNQAWADPANPSNAVPIAVFNQHRSLRPDPPVLAETTRLTKFQAFLMVSGWTTAMYNHRDEWLPPGTSGRSARSDTVRADGRYAVAWAAVARTLANEPVSGESDFAAGDEEAYPEFERLLRRYYLDGSGETQQQLEEMFSEIAAGTPEAEAILRRREFKAEQTMADFVDIAARNPVMDTNLRRYTDPTAERSLWHAMDVVDGNAAYQPLFLLPLNFNFQTRVYLRSMALTAPRILRADGENVEVLGTPPIGGVSAALTFPQISIVFRPSGDDPFPEPSPDGKVFVYRLWRDNPILYWSEDYQIGTRVLLGAWVMELDPDEYSAPRPLTPGKYNFFEIRLFWPDFSGLRTFEMDCIRAEPRVAYLALEHPKYFDDLEAYVGGLAGPIAATIEAAGSLGARVFGEDIRSWLFDTPAEISPLSNPVTADVPSYPWITASYLATDRAGAAVRAVLPDDGDADRAIGRVVSYTPATGEYRDDASGLFKKPGPVGAAMDSKRRLYTMNAASQASFGGRIFGYTWDASGTLSEREYVGSVNYYSQLLGTTKPTSIASLTVGAAREDFQGEELFIADTTANEIKVLDTAGARINSNVNHNVGHRWAWNGAAGSQAAEDRIALSQNSRMAMRSDQSRMYVTQGPRVISVEPGAARSSSITTNGTIFVNTVGCATCSARGRDYVFVADRGQDRVFRIPTEDLPLDVGAASGGAKRDELIQTYTQQAGVAGVGDIVIAEQGRTMVVADNTGLRSQRFGMTGEAKKPGGQALAGAAVRLSMPDGEQTTVADENGIYGFPGFSDYNEGVLSVNHPEHSYVRKVVIDWTCGPDLEQRPVPCIIITDPPQDGLTTNSTITVRGEVFPRSFDFTLSGGELEVQQQAGRTTHALQFTGVDNQFEVPGVTLVGGDTFLRATTFTVGIYASGNHPPLRVRRVASAPVTQSVAGVVPDTNGNPRSGVRVRILVDGVVQDEVTADGCGYYHLADLPMGGVAVEVVE